MCYGYIVDYQLDCYEDQYGVEFYLFGKGIYDDWWCDGCEYYYEQDIQIFWDCVYYVVL